MLPEIANNYKTLLFIWPELIDVSGYRNDYLSKKMGLTPATFLQKSSGAAGRSKMWRGLCPSPGLKMWKIA
jgi:hypothetical protein